MSSACRQQGRDKITSSVPTLLIARARLLMLSGKPRLGKQPLGGRAWDRPSIKISTTMMGLARAGSKRRTGPTKPLANAGHDEAARNLILQDLGAVRICTKRACTGGRIPEKARSWIRSDGGKMSPIEKFKMTVKSAPMYALYLYLKKFDSRACTAKTRCTDLYQSKNVH